MKFLKDWLFWLVVFALALITFCTLTAGVPAASSAPRDLRPASIVESQTVRYFVDAGTGCHYLLTWEGGITPRFMAGGSQVCEEAPE